jgi:hypothetical protein
MSATLARVGRTPAPSDKRDFAAAKPAAPVRAAAPVKAVSVNARSVKALSVKAVSVNAKPEPEILFQTYFKSVGPRTYAAQLKRAGNGNHFLVLTEGKRDDKTGDVRKTRLFVFSEDFVSFFKMLQETSQFIRANPVPPDVKKKRERFWARNDESAKLDAPAGAIQRRPAGTLARIIQDSPRRHRGTEAPRKAAKLG